MKDADAPKPLPMPLARLASQATNANQALERHFAGYYLFEATVRLVAAARPDLNYEALNNPSMGTWAAALAIDKPVSSDRRLAAMMQFIWRTSFQAAPKPKKFSLRTVLEYITHFRNETIGHGAIRKEPGFYERSSRALREGFQALCETGALLPVNARLVLVREVGGSGEDRRVEITALSGAEADLNARTTASPPGEVTAGRLYLIVDDVWHDLFPLILWEETTQRIYCFNGFKGGPSYLDYDSGEFLRGRAFIALFPGVTEILCERCKRPLPVDPDVPEDDLNFNGLSLQRRVGQGGMAEVFLATQEISFNDDRKTPNKPGSGKDRKNATEGKDEIGPRLVAVKRLKVTCRDDPQIQKRFAREIEVLSKCNHPNVVNLLSAGITRGRQYYTMEYLDGADFRRVNETLPEANSLKEALERARKYAEQDRGGSAPSSVKRGSTTTIARLALDEARRSTSTYREIARVFAEAALGVQHLHERKILHRDLKPANIMLIATESRPRAVVTDLGVASVEQDAQDLTSGNQEVLGTLGYLSPERLKAVSDRRTAEKDPRSDIYSLGVCLFETIVGARFARGRSAAEILADTASDKTRLAHREKRSIPRDLSIITAKATAHDPVDRYRSMLEFAEDLERFRHHFPIVARRPTVMYRLSKVLRRQWRVACTLVIALAAMAVLYVWHRKDIARTEHAERMTRVFSAIAANQWNRAEEIIETCDIVRGGVPYKLACALVRAFDRRAALGESPIVACGWDRRHRPFCATESSLFGRDQSDGADEWAQRADIATLAKTRGAAPAEPGAAPPRWTACDELGEVWIATNKFGNTPLLVQGAFVASSLDTVMEAMHHPALARGGSRIASVDEGGVLQVWSPPEPVQRIELPPKGTGRATNVGLTGDGLFCSVIRPNVPVSIIALPSGADVTPTAWAEDPEHRWAGMRAVATATDQAQGWMLAGGSDRGSVRLQREHGNSSADSFDLPVGSATAMAWVVPGESLIIGTDKGAVVGAVLDRNRWLVRWALGHRGAVTCVAVSEDRLHALTGGDDGAVCEWSVDNLVPTPVTNGKQRRVLALDVSADGATLLSVSRARIGLLDTVRRSWVFFGTEACGSTPPAVTARGTIEAGRLIDGDSGLAATSNGDLIYFHRSRFSAGVMPLEIDGTSTTAAIRMEPNGRAARIVFRSEYVSVDLDRLRDAFARQRNGGPLAKEVAAGCILERGRRPSGDAIEDTGVKLQTEHGPVAIRIAADDRRQLELLDLDHGAAFRASLPLSINETLIAVAVAPTQQWLAVANSGGSVQLCDLSTQKKVR